MCPQRTNNIGKEAPLGTDRSSVVVNNNAIKNPIYNPVNNAINSAKMKATYQANNLAKIIANPSIR